MPETVGIEVEKRKSTETVEQLAKRLKLEKKLRKQEEKKAIEIQELEASDAPLPKTPLTHTTQPLKDESSKSVIAGEEEKVPYVPSVENPEKSSHCLDYLRQWKNSPSEWKFQKNKQAWILKQMWNEEKVPKDDFDIVKKYIKKLSGGAKKVNY